MKNRIAKTVPDCRQLTEMRSLQKLAETMGTPRVDAELLEHVHGCNPCNVMLLKIMTRAALARAVKKAEETAHS